MKSDARGCCHMLFFFFFNLFICLAELNLCCCAQAFSSCSEQGLSFIVVCRFLEEMASSVVEHRL